jgi:hypothetical protein
MIKILEPGPLTTIEDAGRVPISRGDFDRIFAAVEARTDTAAIS